MTWTLKDVSGPEMAEWCRLLRDDNAIHLDPVAAEQAGFGPNRVNPGPANLAYLMNVMDGALAEVDARFSGNVLEGDDLMATCDDNTARLLRGADVVVTATFKTQRDT